MSDTEKFVNELLGRMTLDEKIGQLNQEFARDGRAIENIRNGRAGSIINATGALTGQGFSSSVGAETGNRIQNLARESRLKIPLIFGRDVIHGFRTVFPIPLAQAASFNPELARAAAAVAAAEAAADGIKWTFAPMLDIARDPRWGRVAEGSGEDPWHASEMAAAVIEGLQGGDMSQPDKLVACAKHFVGYGAAEGGRDYDNAEISEPTLRDVYMPPFERAVRAGVGSMMAAFLDLNGVPATANRRLLTDVLRGEWNFDGFVVSDWRAVIELIDHGVAADRAEAAALALCAGVDMDMIGGAYLETLADSVRNGRVPPRAVDEAARRILRIKHRAGLFDNPFTDPARAAKTVLSDAARMLARRFARESMVLLKNAGDLLPLAGARRILVAGDFVNASGELYGSWSPDARAEDAVTLDAALRAGAPEGVELYFAGKSDLALAEARRADVVVILAGEHPRRSGENANVADLGLPPGQAQFVEAMAALEKPIVLVVFAGRPLAIARQATLADAVLYAWHPGIEGGAALGDILFGRVAPAGRLPVTIPRSVGQVPVYYNRKNSGRPLRDDTPYQRYLDLPTAPLYPFGYGLTYTTFEYSGLRLSGSRMRDRLEIGADVTNTGRRPGRELVQLYVRDLIGSLTRPVRELKGCRRVELQPGETRRVVFELTEETLAFTRACGTRGVEPGGFQVWIGPDSRGGVTGKFAIDARSRQCAGNGLQRSVS